MCSARRLALPAHLVLLLWGLLFAFASSAQEAAALKDAEAQIAEGSSDADGSEAEKKDGEA